MGGARLVLGSSIRDLTGGFKCFRSEVLRSIRFGSISSRGYAFQVELTYRTARAGYRIVEIPIIFRERRAGASKMSGPIIAEAGWKIPLLRLEEFSPKRRRRAEVV